MLLFDMPLEQLWRYQGTNPRPADFDEYWDAAMAEMKAVDAQLQLQQSDFSVPMADCFDLYFTGVGGSRIHAKYLRPKDVAESHPAVVQFHGYGGAAGDWMDKLGYVAMGYSVFAMDCRGQSGSSEDLGSVRGTTLRGHIVRGLDDRPEKLLFRQIFLDTAQLAGLAMDSDEVDAQRVGVMGGSQGGGLTLACAALEPRVQRLAPIYPFLCDYRRELRAFFRQFDPLHQREEEIFTRLGYIDVQHLAGRIRGEVLMGVGLRDTVCPPSTQFAAYNKITAAKNIMLYPEFTHEALPGFNDHVFRFMQNL